MEKSIQNPTLIKKELKTGLSKCFKSESQTPMGNDEIASKFQSSRLMNR